NFDDYPILRMSETPKVEVAIVNSGEKMGGIGEPGTPPIAPAVANAIFALTGKRLRTLPFVLAALALLFAPRAHAEELSARAPRLVRNAIIVDTHEDVPDALSDKWADVGQRGATKHFDIARAREGGLTAPFFAIYVSSDHADDGPAAGRALELIDLTR